MATNTHTPNDEPFFDPEAIRTPDSTHGTPTTQETEGSPPTPPKVRRPDDDQRKRKENARRMKSDRKSTIAAAKEILGDAYELKSAARKGGVDQVEFARSNDASGDPGDTAMIIRVSNEDKRQGQTVGVHLQRELDFAETNGLRVRFIIIVTECSGKLAYFDRPDYELIETYIEEGLIVHVIWRDVSRMARETESAHTHWRMLRIGRVTLWIVDYYGSIDWEDPHDMRRLNDDLQRAVIETETLLQRTQDATWRKQFDGKGSGTGRPFAIRNARDGWPEVDPELFPWIPTAHIVYQAIRDQHPTIAEFIAETAQSYLGIDADPTAIESVIASAGDSKGLVTLSRVMSHFGFTRGHQTWDTLLRNRVYVDGRYQSSILSVPVWMKPIPLDAPVPESVFMRTQLLLGDTSKKARGARGYTPLRVSFVCTACMNNERPNRLRTKHRGGRVVIGHEFPGECEHGALYWDPVVVTQAVFAAVLAVDADPQRRHAAWVAANERYGDDLVQAAIKARLDEINTEKLECAEQMLAVVREVGRSHDEYEDDEAKQAARHSELVQRGYLNLVQRMTELSRAEASAEELVRARYRKGARHEPTRQEFIDALARVLTLETPADDDMRLLREKVAQACISSIEVTPIVSDVGQVTLRLAICGAMGSFDLTLTREIAPSTTVRELLALESPTVQQSLDYETVGEMNRESKKRSDFVRKMKQHEPRMKMKLERIDWLDVIEIELADADVHWSRKSGRNAKAKLDRQDVSPSGDSNVTNQGSEESVAPNQIPRIKRGSRIAEGQQTIFEASEFDATDEGVDDGDIESAA